MTKDSTIGPEDIPDYIRGKREEGTDVSLFATDDIREARDRFESIFIEKKLRENDFNISQTAKVLNMERSHLHKKIKLYKIEAGR